MTNAKQALSKKTSTAPKKQDKKDEVRGLLMSMKSEINNALPAYLPTDKFIRVALTAINSNPKLLQCNSQSLIAAVMNSAQLGLEFNTPLGEAYLIPYGYNVQFQIGYQGLLKLAHNTKQFKRITAKEVHENDVFSLNYGTGDINHVPVLRGRSGDVIGYYAAYETLDGGLDVFYMSTEDAANYGQTFSKTYKSGPWQTNFDAMAKKSCLIQLLKYAPRAIDKPELSQAMSFDSQVIKDTQLDKDTGTRVYDVDYEVVEDEQIPENVDEDTGEIKEDKPVEDADFFEEGFIPISEEDALK